MANPDQTIPPAWIPSAEVIDHANITAVCRALGLADYPALHRWSVEYRAAYWELVINRLGIKFARPCETILDAAHPTRPRWLVGAKMNIVDSCFLAADDAPAIIVPGGNDAAPSPFSYGQLRRKTARVANALLARGIGRGDAVGVVMPMTVESVAIYLGIIAAGAAVVSIADSFAADEIATRLRIAKASLVFTQDVVPWGAKRLALYEKVAIAEAPPIVVDFADKTTATPWRAGDVALSEFLSSDDRLRTIPADPQDAINILFSSGTTGEPKAIPWDHTTPLKCAADAHFHQDVHRGDITCWPTSLGWMMGPWLIFATLLNRAAMALYPGAPTEAGFGHFISSARVTMLGLVPSLVRAWRQSDCMAGVDWSALRVFSSSGECSNPADMLYLMNMAGGRPIIEYCGGTEIGGAYITGTVVQPCIASTFTTPALGLNFVLIDEAGPFDSQSSLGAGPAEKGEVFIQGPSIGLSTRLLNRDHDAIYYHNTPLGRDGIPLRRHGDELESLSGGYFRVAGRSDDTMNLGGIKVGCAEIERVLNVLPGVQETAAVALPEPGGGPSRLIIFLVAREGSSHSPAEWKPLLQQAIRTHLNPLFHVQEVHLLASLPRTASNKVMRRELRMRMTIDKVGGDKVTR